MKPYFRTLLSIAVIGASVLTFAQNGHAHVHAKISASQARKAALDKYHGTVLGKVALENEDGQWQYSVNVRSGKTTREVMVDANSGKIASVEVTSAKEERAEKRAETKVANHKHQAVKKHK